MDDEELQEIRQAAESFRATIEEWLLNNLFAALYGAGIGLRKFERIDDAKSEVTIYIDDAPGLKIKIVTEWIAPASEQPDGSA